MRKNFRGFTLIELLVVIAIIGLLSSIVLVNMDLPAQRQKARIAKTLEFSSSVQNALGSEAVGIWNFDDCTATDLSGFKNNGTINGATCSSDTPQKIVGAGQGKNSLSFNGVSDYVSAGSTNVPTGDKPITYEAWVKINKYTTGGSGASMVVGRLYSDPHGLLISSTGLVGTRILNGSNDNYYYSNNAISKNLWHHIALSYQSSKVNIYIDGVLDKSTATVAVPGISSGNILMGEFNGGSWYNGLIDEVRIYGQALTLGQIQKHYAEGLEKHKNFVIK